MDIKEISDGIETLRKVAQNFLMLHLLNAAKILTEIGGFVMMTEMSTGKN